EKAVRSWFDWLTMRVLGRTLRDIVPHGGGICGLKVRSVGSHAAGFGAHHERTGGRAQACCFIAFPLLSNDCILGNALTERSDGTGLAVAMLKKRVGDGEDASAPLILSLSKDGGAPFWRGWASPSPCCAGSETSPIRRLSGTRSAAREREAPCAR